MDTKALYETDYKKEGHFRFGQNWRNYLTRFTPQKLAIASASLENFLGGKKAIAEKTFIDVGCGSGIFSLAAHRLNAKKVVSLDVDEQSLECARFLQQQESSPRNWEIHKVSALNRDALKQYGQFDIVYSWGVLHHTGSMYEAIENVTGLVNPNGRLYIAIYNKSRSLTQGKSTWWWRVKKQYNQSSPVKKRWYSSLYAAYLFFGLLVSGKNPVYYIRQYESARGMSWQHDIFDWLGGYPYEFAEPEKIVAFLSDLGFTLQKIQTVATIGCNEYVFVREKPLADLPAVTVLLAAHNAAPTLDKTLTSIFNQTLAPRVICVNDASTDTTGKILKQWHSKVGPQLHIVTNKKNLGLTQSLNKGLAQSKTTYTARIDADDWWEATKLEKQVNFLEANPDYGIVGCWYNNHGHKKSVVNRPPMTDAVIHNRIIRQNPFAHSCVVFRTSLVQKANGYDSRVRYGQDYELWLRLSPETKFFNLPLVLCHRSIVDGISINKQKQQMRFALQTRIKYIHRYHMGLSAYTSLIEPGLVYLTPRWLADYKRRLGDR